MFIGHGGGSSTFPPPTLGRGSIKTLRLNCHGYNRNDGVRRNPRNSADSKVYKTFKYLVGKIPKCDSFRINYQILMFKVRGSEEEEIRYVVLGCGNSLICERCGKISSAKKYFRVRSLLVSLSNRFPDSQMASIIFTIPHDHYIHKNLSRKNLIKVFDKVRKIIKTIFPDCPFLSVLHTWSSSDPNNRHVHIHCLIFGIRANARLWHLFYPQDTIKKMWQQALKYPFDINLHMQYWKLKNMRKTIHCLRYTLRSPIIDFLKQGNIKLTRKFLDNVNPLLRLHRMRWYGWMCNRNLKKTLETFGIKLVVQHPEITYEFLGFKIGYFDKISHRFVLQSGRIIKHHEILEAETFIKKWFFRVRAPPD